MPKNKRLHFKDIDALRFFAFLPVLLFTSLYLTSTQSEGFHYELTQAMRFLKLNSFDFYFFISSFLLTAQALREYKYNENFTLKGFYIRRFMRLIPLSLVIFLFSFMIYPMIIKTLKLNATMKPQGSLLHQLIPEYFTTYVNEQYIYSAVIWVILMFSVFYLVWGPVLKLGRNAIKIISIVSISVGLISRILCFYFDYPLEFNLLNYGASVGIGAWLALLVRNDSPWLNKVRDLSKKVIVPIYVLGLLFVCGAYLFLSGSVLSVLIPVFSGIYFSFILIEQTFGKKSPFKFRNNKIITHLGKISFGLYVYHAILSILIVIGIESLDFELNSLTTKILVLLLSFVLSWITADLSYNFIEKPLLRLRREFKKI